MCDKLIKLSIFLGNEEIYNKMVELYPKEKNDDKIKTYLEYLQFYSTIDNVPAFSKDSIIDFISSQFYSIDKSALLKLPRSILYLIISNKHLKLSSEDCLLDFINDLFSESNDDNDNYKSLFYEQIYLSELSDEKLKDFLSKVEISMMTNTIWFNIKSLLDSIENLPRRSKLTENQNRYSTSKNEEKNNQKKIEYDNNSNNRFNGIFTFLGKGNSKNLVDDGIIGVTSSEMWEQEDDWEPKNIFNFNDDRKCFDSADKPDSWVCIDFKENRIAPTHYSIRSNGYGDKGWCHLKNWNIEGSNDNNEWTILDSRQNIASLDDRSASDTFEIENKLGGNGHYRYLRIQQTGLNSRKNNQLFFSVVEFFGNLILS